ncbi:MAG: choice-of-anchor U domain-containing protein [Euryarchaeota archaeon]|nr:choice-of-anchor U domain-containing protein [Euryarchaeota archaeon]
MLASSENVPAGAAYRKYGPTPGDACARWYQIPISDDGGDRIIAITLTDRGIGDDDDDEFTANGVIVGGGGDKV